MQSVDPYGAALSLVTKAPTSNSSMSNAGGTQTREGERETLIIEQCQIHKNEHILLDQPMSVNKTSSHISVNLASL